MANNRWSMVVGICGYALVFAGCGGEAFSGSISGNVQKGPFINGTEITVNELTEELDQTGRSFSGTISDDRGSFRVASVALESGYARVRANGFYFDETSGEISDGPLSLVTLVDFTQADQANINILGHLQAPRIEYLIQEEGLEFEEARAQAHQEVLDVFYFSAASSATADELDISADGDDNAMLLAASVIVQNTRSVGELSELLSAIQTDLRTNGELNSTSTGEALMNGARTAIAANVRSNLEARFDALGLSATVPDFETYLEQFIAEAPYEFTGGIEYPATGQLQHSPQLGELPNVLDPEATEFTDLTGPGSYGEFPFIANLPSRTALSVRLTLQGEVDGDGVWVVTTAGNQGWEVSAFDNSAGTQTFRATETGQNQMTHFGFHGTGQALVEYFEYGSTEPTQTKTIEWDFPDG
jgi:hypothetical protein